MTMWVMLLVLVLAAAGAQEKDACTNVNCGRGKLCMVVGGQGECVAIKPSMVDNTDCTCGNTHQRCTVEARPATNEFAICPNVPEFDFVPLRICRFSCGSGREMCVENFHSAEPPEYLCMNCEPEPTEKCPFGNNYCYNPTVGHYDCLPER
eukprot:Sspe_Gene.103211::Locus_79032_Transcript_1_1_Confidence_1.000_Length_499::g.103211::m.103211